MKGQHTTDNGGCKILKIMRDSDVDHKRLALSIERAARFELIKEELEAEKDLEAMAMITSKEKMLTEKRLKRVHLESMPEVIKEIENLFIRRIYVSSGNVACTNCEELRGGCLHNDNNLDDILTPWPHPQEANKNCKQYRPDYEELKKLERETPLLLDYICSAGYQLDKQRVLDFLDQTSRRWRSELES